MKGIAFLPILIAILAIGGGLLTYTYFIPSKPIDQKNPIDIISDMIRTAPVGDLIDFFVGGVFGVFKWFMGGMINLLNWVLSVIAQKQIILPTVMSYVIMAFVGILIIWGLFNRAWGVGYEWLVRLLIVFGIATGIGITLIYLGLI